MRRTAALVLILTVVLGCSSQDVTETRTDRPTRSPSTTPLPRPTGVPPATKVPWRVLARVPRADGATGIKSDGHFQVSLDESDPDESTPQVIRVMDPRGRVVLERRGATSGSFVQDVWLSGGHLVLEEIDERARKVRLRAFDLDSGLDVGLPGRARPTQPEVDANGGRIAFVTGTMRTRMCVVLVDLDQRTSKVLACDEPGAILGDIALSGDEVLYSSLTDVDTDRRCKRLRTIAADGTTQEIPALARCLGWSGVITADAVAWDEADPNSSSLAYGEGFVRYRGEPTVALGPMKTDSMVSCGGRLFWTIADGRGDRVDRWSPPGNVATVLGPWANVGMTSLHCTEDRWLTLRTDDVDGEDEHFTHYLLDARRS
jgi:hypothetical protein